MAQSATSKNPFRRGDGRSGDPHGSNAFSRLSVDGSGRNLSPIRLNTLLRWGMLALTMGILVFLFPHAAELDQSRELGSIWSADTVRAPFSFPLYKDQQTRDAEVKKAQDSVLLVFTPTGNNATLVRDSLMRLALFVDSNLLGTNLPLTEKSIAWARSIPEGERHNRLMTLTTALAESLEEPFTLGVVDRAKSSIERDRIVVRNGAALEEEVAVATIYDSLEVMQRLDADLARKGIREEDYAVALDMVRAVWQPTVRFSQPLTEEAQKIAANAVPETQGLVREGQVIVTPGEQVTERIDLMLSSLERSQRLRQEQSSRWLKLLGSIGHVFILLGLPLIYLYNFRRRIFIDNLQLGIILGSILLVAILAWLSVRVVTPLPIEYLILMPFLSTLLAILFDSRTAFYLTVAACLIVAGIRGADYAVAIALLSAGVLGAYTVRDIKSRTQLYRSIAYSVFGFVIAIIALGLEKGDPMDAISLQLGLGSINAIVSPVLTFGAIFLLEHFFNVATDLKLLEYDDLNHPLLRMLADKAPGTYQHTLTIARLAESAANAIGANSLQTKVGAYFHDIGKIARSEYFVENQMGMDNKHDKIRPEQSVKVIREHVLDGIKIARQYGLPERIIDFIPTHHGTTTIKYFLDKAKEENPDVDAELFRYPGPLPHTRETAVVMLADAVEATTRSLPDPTAQKIKETVDQIIKRRFSDGQLDQCDLTLADLTRIREAFVKNLVGMAHPRIQYKNEEKPNREALANLPHVEDPFSGLRVGEKVKPKKKGRRSKGEQRSGAGRKNDGSEPRPDVHDSPLASGEDQKRNEGESGAGTENPSSAENRTSPGK